MLNLVESRGGMYSKGVGYSINPTEPGVPRIVSLLGAEYVAEIWLPIETFSTEERDRIQSLFPEARIARNADSGILGPISD